MLEVRAEAVVFLGALCDPSGSPREWVEIRVQEISGIEGKLSADAKSLTNPMLDDRWMDMVESHAHSDRDALFRGPWETLHCPPSFLNAQGTALAVLEGDWKLCQDDDLLLRHGLKTYSGSFHRYLYSDSGEEMIFVPLTEGAPCPPSTRKFSVIFKDLQPINREGGLLMIRRLPGLKFEDFTDFLGGKDFGADPRELLRVPAVGPYKGFIEKNAYAQAGIGFIHGRTSVAERVAEILFLKLTALRGAFGAIADSLAVQKLPFLGLRGESFAVSISDPAPGLPFLWNHRVHHCAVSTVVSVPLGVGDEVMLLPCEEPPRSIYRPDRLAQPIQGQGRVRIRDLAPKDEAGLFVIQGTLQTNESLRTSRKDLLEMDLRLARGKRFKIYATFVPQREVGGENRFLSLPIALPPEVVEELDRGGMQFSERVDFQILPRLGATCDLFSMGVLAARTMLCSSNRVLAECIDDLLGLVHAYGATFEASEWDTGSGQLAAFMAGEKGAPWREKLGAAWVAEGISAEDAAAAIPSRLWWQIVLFIGRLFPGEMPGSFAKDFDDFDSRAPERVFAEPIEALDGLVQAARSLLFGNPVASREILTVIRGIAAKYR